MKWLTFFYSSLLSSIIVLADAGVLAHMLALYMNFPMVIKRDISSCTGFLTLLINLTSSARIQTKAYPARR